MDATLNAKKEFKIKLEDGLLKDKNGALYQFILDAVEKPLIEDVLRYTGGNQLKASRILGLNRNTIRAKIKKLGISVAKWKVF
jgi:DNA-binding protein Fis